MQCREFERMYAEQTRAALQADAVVHLSACPACSALVADLEAIEATARQIGQAEPAPPERVWLALRMQLEAEGLLRPPEEAPASSRGWLAGWFAAIPRPILAGAYLTAVLAAAILFTLQAWLAPPSARLLAEGPIATIPVELNKVERGTVASLHRHDPEVTSSLRRNLALVDNVITLCEKSVREEPENELAREYLYNAYQQKADLLATMMDRGALGD